MLDAKLQCSIVSLDGNYTVLVCSSVVARCCQVVQVLEQIHNLELDQVEKVAQYLLAHIDKMALKFNECDARFASPRLTHTRWCGAQ